jgi:hypothetical protein
MLFYSCSSLQLTTTLLVSIPKWPSLSITVSSNRYELELTFPAIIGAINVAMEVFSPFSKIVGHHFGSELPVPFRTTISPPLTD